MKGWVEGHPLVFSVGPPLISSSITCQPVASSNLGGIDVHALVDTGSMKFLSVKNYLTDFIPAQL